MAHFLEGAGEITRERHEQATAIYALLGDLRSHASRRVWEPQIVARVGHLPHDELSNLLTTMSSLKAAILDYARSDGDPAILQMLATDNRRNGEDR